MVGGPHVFVDQIRFFCNGTLVEDLLNHSRLHTLFQDLLQPKNYVQNQATEYGLAQTHDRDFFPLDDYVPERLLPGEPAECMTPVLCGLVNGGKLLPTFYAQVSLTFPSALRMTVLLELFHPFQQPISRMGQPKMIV